MDVEKTLKWIGAVVALGGLALGVVNYLATVPRDAETRNLEARKQSLTRQLDLYAEATRAAAKLATAARLAGVPQGAHPILGAVLGRALDGREPRSGVRHEAHGRLSERPVRRLPEPGAVLARSRPRLPSIAGRVLGHRTRSTPRVRHAGTASHLGLFDQPAGGFVSG